LGKAEKNLLVRLGLGMDPNDPGHGQIARKALASLDPSRAKSPRDQRARVEERRRIQSELQDMTSMPESAVLPGYGRYDQRTPTNTGLFIPERHVRELADKIVRGVTFIEDAAFIEPPWRVDYFFSHDVPALPLIDLLRKHGKRLERGSSVEIYRVVPPDEPRASAVSVTIWQKFKFYAMVDNEEMPHDA